MIDQAPRKDRKAHRRGKRFRDYNRFMDYRIHCVESTSKHKMNCKGNVKELCHSVHSVSLRIASRYDARDNSKTMSLENNCCYKE